MAYQDKVAADGATRYWRLAEVSGTTAFATIGGVNIAIGGVPAVVLNEPGAIPGNPSMKFAGDTALSASPITIPVTATVEVWFRQLASVTGYSAVLSTRDAGTTAGNLFIGVHDGHAIDVLGPGAEITGVKNVRDGLWHHLAVTFNGTTAQIYLDGGLEKSGAFVRAAASALPLGLGWDPAAGGLNWYGWIDEPAIYPSVLSAAAITAHVAEASASVSDFMRAPWRAALLEDEMGIQAYNVWETLAPSDTIDLPRVARGVWVGGAGNVAAVMEHGDKVVVFTAVPAGAWLPLAVKRVNATGTTATALIALYNV